jgi:hypothetical protein
MEKTNFTDVVKNRSKYFNLKNILIIFGCLFIGTGLGFLMQGLIGACFGLGLGIVLGKLITY